MKLRLSTLITLALSVSAFAADVNGSPSATSKGLAEQHLRQDMQMLLSRMSASGMLGDHPEDVHLSIDEPGRRVADLGVLVDSTSGERAHDGLRIVGTTPGGSAEHGGLRPGDVIVSVNGTSLKNLGADPDGRALAAATLRSSVNEASKLQLDVMRNGDLVAMNVPVQSVFVPAMRVELGSATVDGANRRCFFVVVGLRTHQHASTWRRAPSASITPRFSRSTASRRARQARRRIA